MEDKELNLDALDALLDEPQDVQQSEVEQEQKQEEQKQEAQPQPQAQEVVEVQQEPKEEEEELELDLVGDIPPLEEALPPNELARTAEFIAKQADAIYKQTFGEDYDPLTATPQQREYYELLRENIRKQVQKQYVLQERYKQLDQIARQLETKEPNINKIIDWVKSDAPVKLVREMQKASVIALNTGDYSHFVRAWKRLRDAYYAQHKPPEPPRVEKAGTQKPTQEVVVPRREEILSRLRSARGNLSAIAEALPDDIL